MSAALDKNILVISDLHLGEDLRPGGANVSYLRHLVKLERELENFLKHYTETRLDERPWCLVVNGDMVDFMSVMILPDAPSAAEAAASPESLEDEDLLYGLGFGERQSLKKLERVIVRHQAVFRALAEFVAVGNELVIVVGNHDVEFHYQEVQKTLTEWLCGLMVGAGAAPEARAEFAARIQFCPWFYYRENLIYIEHGHQYDEYCSFDYVLRPVEELRGGKKSGMALSMAHAGMRYFANQLPEYDPHTAEHWGFANYMRWAWAQGVRGAIRLCYFYGLLVWRVVELWYSLKSADTERRQVHTERLKALSTHLQLAEEQLHALNALRRVPVIRRLWSILSTLFLDRVLLGVVAFGVALGLALHLHGWSRTYAPAAVFLATFGVNLILNRIRLQSPAKKLRAAPQLIERLFRAPFIVFGHSHAPETMALDGGGIYFNTGTWASEDIQHAFTHLVVTRSEGDAPPQAELRQWRDGSSTPYRR